MANERNTNSNPKRYQENVSTSENVDGSPDMRKKENRDDPQKVAEANQKKQEQESAQPGEGLNKDGTPDHRLKENR
jgi:hypothetical protein